MALPDTTTLAKVFIEDAPDFAKQISLTSVYRTTSFTSRAGGEQRARRRNRPRFSISYTLSDMNFAESSLRRSKAIRELQSPVVVPIWTDFETLDSMTDPDTAELVVALAARKFKAGSYAYFVQDSLVSTFRLITAVNATSLALSDIEFIPTGSLPEFTAGARVYPCILGMRTENNANFTLSRFDQTTEQISIDEL